MEYIIWISMSTLGPLAGTAVLYAICRLADPTITIHDFLEGTNQTRKEATK